MIPRPPFVSELTLEQELAEFERLKPRLAEVWDAITNRDEEPHTSVVVPSLSLDQSELKKIAGESFYEERPSLSTPMGGDALGARPRLHFL